MINCLMSLPGASWKLRWFAGFALVLGVGEFAWQWARPHDDLAVACSIVGVMLFSAAARLPGVLVVWVAGGTPGHWQGHPGRLHGTLPLHRGVARQQGERRRRSRLP